MHPHDPMGWGSKSLEKDALRRTRPVLPLVLLVFVLHVSITVITWTEPLTVHSLAVTRHINDLILGIDAAIQAIAIANF
jgi:hypothetical protein